MKNLNKLLIALMASILILGCTKNEVITNPDEAQLKSNKEMIQNTYHGLDQDRYVTMKEEGLNIHYRIIGKGPIDIVFLPGWTNPETVFSKQYNYFRDKARAIYIDLPGTGLSDAPPAGAIPDTGEDTQYTMQLMAKAVKTVLKKEGVHQFVGVGFSMGATVLPVFERLYPGMMYKLVIIDGTYQPWPSDPDEIATLEETRMNTYLAQLEWTSEIKQGLLGVLIPPELEGDLADELKEWGLYFVDFPSDILANTYYHMSAQDANELVDWTYPKLCFFSSPDTPEDFINYIFPNNEMYIFPDGGHVIHWMFHEEINPIIWEFIKDRPGMKY